jgi:hypothetical protein
MSSSSISLSDVRLKGGGEFRSFVRVGELEALSSSMSISSFFRRRGDLFWGELSEGGF